MRTKSRRGRDMNHVVDLEQHSNDTILPTVLPQPEEYYADKLNMFQKFLALHPTAINPPNIQTCRAFLEWSARGMDGRIGERPTVDTMLNFMRDFAAALQRKTKFALPQATKTTMREFIKGELRFKVGLETGKMVKDDGVSPNDLIILMTQLWCRDHHEYRGTPPDRARVQLSAAMLLYYFTSARTGEVHESTNRRQKARRIDEDRADSVMEARVTAACYKHFVLTIEEVDGIITLVLTYQREFVKGHVHTEKWETPRHAFYDVYAENVPLFLNFLTFFLPMAAADNAFERYCSVMEILDAINRYESFGPSENKILEVIQIRKEVEELPVFRQYIEHDVENCKGHARGADSFGKSLVSLGHRSGYSNNITVRACRRRALQQADKSHSECARMKFGSHVSHGAYGKSYAHPLSEIDGPSNFLSIVSRQEDIQSRRDMGVYYNTSLPQVLSAKAEYEFLARKDISTLDDSLAQLSLTLSEATPQERDAIQLEQKMIYAQRRRLYVEAFQSLEPLEEDQHGRVFTETMFYYRRRVMPHRDFLAMTLPSKIGLRSLDGTKVLEALESLCTETDKVAFRDSLSPINDACLCGTPMQELFDHRKWLHLYRCHSHHYQSHYGFAEMCFECDIWVTNKSEWEAHCQQHLDSPADLLRCDPLIFRNAPIKPGLCPFCLGDRSKLPSKRMFQFILSPPEWHSHIEGHLKQLIDFNCKHPACSTVCQSIEGLTDHLANVHCWRPRRGSPKKRKWFIREE